MVIIETDRFLRLPHLRTKCFHLRLRMSLFVLPDHHPRLARVESADPAAVGKVQEMKLLRSLMPEMLSARERAVRLHLEEEYNIIIFLLFTCFLDEILEHLPFPLS